MEFNMAVPVPRIALGIERCHKQHNVHDNYNRSRELYGFAYRSWLGLRDCHEKLAKTVNSKAHPVE